jgi:hypothetical protein
VAELNSLLVLRRAPAAASAGPQTPEQRHLHGIAAAATRQRLTSQGPCVKNKNMIISEFYAVAPIIQQACYTIVDNSDVSAITTSHHF